VIPPHVVLPLPHLHGVAVAVALRGGPRFEGKEEGGLTHFLEHMLFRGAGERQRISELMAAFERVGGEPEAYTGEDAITLLAEFDPRYLDEGVRLLADVLLRPAYGDLEAERALILEERLERVDEDGHPCELEDLAMGLAFRGHPLGRSILGRKRTIQGVTREDLESWRGRIVVRENVAVAMAGAVDEERARAALAPLRELPSAASLGSGSDLPEPGGPRSSFYLDEGGTQTELRLSFRAPGERDPAFPVLRVLTDLLDGGPTGRLPATLVDGGLAYNAGADLMSLHDGSLVGVELAVSHNKVEQALAALWELVSGFAKGVADEELERAALRREQRARKHLDDARGAAEWAARSHLYGLSTDAAQLRAAEAAVTASDLAALARRVFSPDNLSVAAICARKPQRRIKKALAAWE
jgi:predicted Zn-dependent peptidase